MKSMDILPLPSFQLIRYDPATGLKKITVAESAERLFRRAKDVTLLKTAIEAKLVAQGEYVCWRDTGFNQQTRDQLTEPDHL